MADERWRHALAPLLAATAMIGGFLLARLPETPPDERRAMAARFAFERSILPTASPGDARSVRVVHPDLRGIAGWISTVGAAAALGDLDGDGVDDECVLVDPRTDSVSVIALGEPASRPFALTPGGVAYAADRTAPMGSLIGDFDEDGAADVLVYYWGRAPIAFLRTAGGDDLGGDGLDAAAFVAVDVVATTARWYTNAATQADLDGDGHLDLVFGNYFPDDSGVLDPDGTGRFAMQHGMSRATNGGADRVLLWQAPSAPARIAYAACDDAIPAVCSTGWTLALGCCDLDGDLLPELYLANDFGQDRLLHNRSRPGRVAFALVEGRRGLADPRSKVLGRDSFKGMGVDFADLNGDGMPDILVSNIADRFALEESHFLFASDGRATALAAGEAPYRDVSEDIGLSRSSWAWDCKLDDFDDDGVAEAVQALGFLKGDDDRWAELQELAIANDDLVADTRAWPVLLPGDALSGDVRTAFFARDGSGRYADLAADLGWPIGEVARGIAIGDADGDGRLDLVIAAQWQDSVLCLNRTRADNAFLTLRILQPLAGGDGRAATRHRPAIGAHVVVRDADGGSRHAWIDGGNGHSGKRAPQAHFGLGRDARPRAIEIAWRDARGIHRHACRLAPGRHTILLDAGSAP
ncbi:MAG TPA: CRTAC1 family protein [Planctomycetota bacterium]|nr:CRTAC1 family protein [Planctomycetota bacterium]